jgi:hypothetical protein
MKNNIIYISVLLSAGWFSSCKKQLDLLPSDSIPPAKALTTISDLQQGLFGVYSANVGSDNKVYIGSILADEAKLSNSNRGQGQFTFKWQYSAGPDPEDEHNIDFANYFSMIDDDNRILAVIDNVATNGASDVAQKKRIKAELTALRGVAYYEVLIRFMNTGYDANSLGVPVVLVSDLLGQPARAKVGDVIKQITADLAVGRAEPTIPSAPDDVVRLSQATIAAYQARVSILTKDWAGAITHAKEALQLSGKSLATGQTFTDYWFDRNESETLWKYRNGTQPQLFWTDTNGDVFFEPADKLKNEFDRVNDIRFGAYFAIDETAVDTAIVNKYPGSADGPQVNDIKIVRVAELYLDLAEAYAQTSDLGNAAANLNTLRAARINNYVNVSFASQSDAVQAALDERYKELCFEGFRFFDLKRNSLPVNRLATDVQSVNWQNLLANDYHFALPIPLHEMFANKNMVQNPGY